jgi:hypothetical protein
VLWVGARFSAQLAIVSGEPVAIDCEVRRIEPRRGMGLTFTPSQESGRMAISSFIRQLAAR